jgi:hypothetical protein
LAKWVDQYDKNSSQQVINQNNLIDVTEPSLTSPPPESPQTIVQVKEEQLPALMTKLSQPPPPVAYDSDTSSDEEDEDDDEEENNDTKDNDSLVKDLPI